MRAPKTLRWCIASSLSLVFAVGVTIAQAPKPKRINRAIELLDQGQPIYYTGSHSGTSGGYEAGITFCTPEAEGIIVDASLQLLRQVTYGN